ncbi:MAG: hypothetical protein WA970_15275, partial [Gammaproteobacteria bacterium]
RSSLDINCGPVEGVLHDYGVDSYAKHPALKGLEQAKPYYPVTHKARQTYDLTLPEAMEGSDENP